MKVGVIIARFQGHTLHAGHCSLLARVQQLSDRMVVILGIAPVSTRDPLSYSLRQHMVLARYPNAVVWGVGNYRSDRDWAGAIDSFLYWTFPGAEITLYGCRDSCLEQYAAWGYNKTETLSDGPETSATSLRNSVAELDTAEFRAGVIHGISTTCSRVHTAVDIALYNYIPSVPMVTKPDTPAVLRVLLVRKQGEHDWRFPGGCVDAEDGSFLRAAQRELYEETGLTGHTFTHVNSRRIDDWRYRRTGISTFSTLYAATYTHGYPKPQDREIADAKWVGVNESVMDVTVVPEHRDFYLDFLKFAKDRSLLP